MIFDSGMMTHEESLVLRWLKNGTLCLYTSRLCEYLWRAHSLGDLFLAPRHFFSVWTVCVSFDGSHFWFQFLGPNLLFHWAKPKMASFLKSNFGFEWEPTSVFFGVYQLISLRNEHF